MHYLKSQLIFFVGSWGYRGAAHGRAIGWIPLDDVRCTGNEERLIDCHHRNSTVQRDCTHHKDASVVCQPSIIFMIYIASYTLACNC